MYSCYSRLFDFYCIASKNLFRSAFSSSILFILSQIVRHSFIFIVMGLNSCYMTKQLYGNNLIHGSIPTFTSLPNFILVSNAEWWALLRDLATAIQITGTRLYYFNRRQYSWTQGVRISLTWCSFMKNNLIHVSTPLLRLSIYCSLMLIYCV
jgi:hypothetical protein